LFRTTCGAGLLASTCSLTFERPNDLQVAEMRLRLKYEFPTLQRMHVYEVRPRKDHRGVDLISDVLPFGRRWYGETNAVSNAIDYAKFFGCSHDAVIRVYAPEGSRTVGVWEAGIALGKRIVSHCPEATDLSGRFQRRVR
jgi:hypothetical protein